MSRITYVLIAILVTAAPAFAQTWQIDTAHSRAQFTVRHLMISNIRGDFGAVTGTVDYDGKDITKAKVNATIDVKSISTRVEKRDEHLKTDDFLDVANHPTMTFVSTSITPAAGGKYNMAGNLTIRGTTKPVTFELTAPSGPITTRGDDEDRRLGERQDQPQGFRREVSRGDGQRRSRRGRRGVHPARRRADSTGAAHVQ